ncbi:MAG: HAD family phosphatase [Proteobacteria bacterium]|nr:HAD family phosphatase [Pseudomonadota bacterium]
MACRAVIFDLGGVVLGSPLHAIAAYERESGIPAGFINRVVVDTAPAGAWSRLERGELRMEPFFADFEADCAAAGQQISARTMMSRMAESAAPREAMLVAIERIRANGLGVAALTNNWAREDRAATEDGTRALRDLFDVFVESSVEGLRKPDPRIYELACQRLDVTPPEAVFLDDIGRNLKPARALGMVTIKVDDPATALADLERVVGFALGD